MKHISTLDQPETDEILLLLDTFVTLWNAKDPEQFGAIFTENAEYTDVVGQVATNRQAIIEQHRFPFAVVNKLAVFSILEAYIRPLNDDLIIVSGKWLTENSTTPTGQVLPPREGIIQIVCQRNEADLWLVRLVHNADSKPVYERQERFINE